MNEEVEVKFTLENPDEVENKLKEIAKFVKAINQKDEYYVPKHEDYFVNIPANKYFRIRHQDGKSEVAYHFTHYADDGDRLKADEYETGVDDPIMMSNILKQLQFNNKITVTKHRKVYLYKTFEVVLDYIEELGHFVEVEVKEMEDSFQEELIKCRKIIEELGVKGKEVPEKGYPDLINEKKDL